MYAVLHIPTGRLMGFPKGYWIMDISHILRSDPRNTYEINCNWIRPEDRKIKFYSVKEAELARRKFLVYLYLFAGCCENVVFPARYHIPKFLKKKRRSKTYNITSIFFETAMQSLEQAAFPFPGQLIALAKEFVIIKVQ